MQGAEQLAVFVAALGRRHLIAGVDEELGLFAGRVGDVLEKIVRDGRAVVHDLALLDIPLHAPDTLLAVWLAADAVDAENDGRERLVQRDARLDAVAVAGNADIHLGQSVEALELASVGGRHNVFALKGVFEQLDDGAPGNSRPRPLGLHDVAVFGLQSLREVAGAAQATDEDDFLFLSAETR